MGSLAKSSFTCKVQFENVLYLFFFPFLLFQFIDFVSKNSSLTKMFITYFIYLQLTLAKCRFHQKGCAW